MPLLIRLVYIIVIGFLIVPVGQAGDWKIKLPSLETFISDTLSIVIPVDSTRGDFRTDLDVIDSRELEGSMLGISQTKKYKYIPVDQYLVLNQSLAELFQDQFARDSLQLAGTLHVSKLILWWDGAPYLDKGQCLNAYTSYHDTTGEPVSDWMWEIRLKREKKEEWADYLSRHVQELTRLQSAALATADFKPEFYPHLFRRQLMTWSEFIYFKDGFALNAHFTLDFPPDQERDWKRGSPGLFYRKSKIHESIAIGGQDQHWYRRLSSNWILQGSGTFRLGFNNFEGGHFEHLDYWNIFYLNLSGQASIEYRPVYHKGVFGGLGLYSGYNILPDVIPQAELGLLLRVGVLLP